LKHLTIVCLIALIISGFALVLQINLTHAATVSGIMTSNTTWTPANSPYDLTGNVLVNDGVTLTVEPGVTVNLGSYYIMVNGTLQATGEGADPTHFNSGQITFTEFSSDWNESASTGSIIENAILDSTLTLNNSLKLYGCTTYSAINIQTKDGIPTVSKNTLRGGINVGMGSMPVISNNTILDSGISIFLANATVTGNTITGTQTGIAAYTDYSGYGWYNCTSLIENNLIYGNTYGLAIREQQGSTVGAPLVRNNTIVNNGYGISISWIGIAAPNPTILYNNIYGNSNYNIRINIPTNVNATYNWWGTTDTQAIDQSIYDYYDDFTLGKVIYTPFLTAENVIPEFPSNLLMVLIVIFLSSAASFSKMKTNKRR
jgi:hypothetical protein